MSGGHKNSRVGPVCSHKHARSITLIGGHVLAWDLSRVDSEQSWAPGGVGVGAPGAQQGSTTSYNTVKR